MPALRFLAMLTLLSAWGCMTPTRESAAPSQMPRVVLSPPAQAVVQATETLPTLAAIIQPPISTLSTDHQPTETPEPETTPEPAQATHTPAPIVTFSPDYNPLTGQTVDDPAVLDRRPIVVKVSNSPGLVRPQSGLSQADWVFEHYTEAGITRFSALFYGQAPRRVGSVRSARLIDYELAPMYDALLAFSGASIGVDKRIYGSEAVIDLLCRPRQDAEQCRQDVLNAGPVGFIPPSDFVQRAYKGVLFGPPAFIRDESIPVPHNYFVDLWELWARAERDGNGGRPSLRGALTFSDEPPAGGQPSPALEVRYATTVASWKYVPEMGRYRRITDGVPQIDANNDQPIMADNVIVLYAGHYLTDIVESQWRDTVHWSEQITVWPEGEMILWRDGQRYEGRWLRLHRSEPLTFVAHTGDPLPLKRGQTWVQLVRLPDQMNAEREWVRWD
ncbi:MAG: DUF3048 domain-containing protein [Anaerolineae bacterium]|nr:DUF3048 domain-containing protein [Anaerolineae bacterium]